MALLLAAIVSVQFGGAVAALLIPRVGAVGAVALRVVLSAVILTAIARPRVRGRSAADWRVLLAYAASLTLMNVAFYLALARLPLGVAVTIEFTGPLVLAAVLSRRRVDALAVLVAAVGVVLISEALSVRWAELDHLGILMALLAGACWAAYIVTGGHVGRRFEGLDALALALCLGAVPLVPIAAVTAGGDLVDPTTLLQAVGIAVLSSLIPYSLELMALRRLSAGVFGVLLSLEPAVAALAGMLVLSQFLDPLQVLGMGCVVGASVVVLGARRGSAVKPVAPE